MAIQKNINFDSFITNEKFKIKTNKKTFENSIIKIKKNIYQKKKLFHSFSKEFNLNLNLKDLKKYKKFKRIVTWFCDQFYQALKVKEKKKELIFVNN